MHNPNKRILNPHKISSVLQPPSHVYKTTKMWIVFIPFFREIESIYIVDEEDAKRKSTKAIKISNCIDGVKNLEGIVHQIKFLFWLGDQINFS